MEWREQTIIEDENKRWTRIRSRWTTTTTMAKWPTRTHWPYINHKQKGNITMSHQPIRNVASITMEIRIEGVVTIGRLFVGGDISVTQY